MSKKSKRGVGYSDLSPAAVKAAAGSANSGVRTQPDRVKAAMAAKKPEGFIKQAEPGLSKAAKFLMLLGKEQAADILKHMDLADVEKISRSIADVETINTEEANKILSEFGIIRARGASVQGGPEVAKEMLTSAFGEEQGQRYFKKVVPHGGNKPFDFLNDYEFPQILMILKKEPANVLGVIMPYLQPEKASRVLEALPLDVQRKVVRHIASMKTIDSEVLTRMEEVIKKKIRTQGKVVTEEIDGRQALAEILRHVNPSAEREILSQIESIDPDLGEDIRERLFTMDSVLSVYDRDLQEVLRDYADDELALILRGKPEEVKQKILGNVSERRRELIREDMEIQGSVKKSDVERATKDFLRYIQLLLEEGKIVMINPENNDTLI
jgi:flagellar motor switch protein FliG